MKHTECDLSYTVICVPQHLTEETQHSRCNKAEVEFNVGIDNELVLKNVA